MLKKKYINPEIFFTDHKDIICNNETNDDGLLFARLSGIQNDLGW